MDPIDEVYFSGGFLWFDNTTGQRSTADGRSLGLNLFTSDNSNLDTFYGKANGLGDAEFVTPAAELEIGDRIWFDIDLDGIQDAGEANIADGVTVQLYDVSNPLSPTLVGTTTTSDGQYLFNDSNVAYSDGGEPVGLRPFTDYEVRLVSSDFQPGGLLENTTVTLSNQGANDGIDSDAVIASGVPTISYRTNESGHSDHTLDIGIIPGYDLALTKVYTSDTFDNVTDGVVEAGSDVTYTIEVTNQGGPSASAFTVTDYIPLGFSLNDANWTFNNDANATSGGTATFNYTGAALANGQSTQFTITLTAVNPAVGASVNRAEVSVDDGDDIDSTPDTNANNDNQPATPGAPTDNVIDNSGGDEDDHDIAGVTVAEYDLALTKVYTSDSFGNATDSYIQNGSDVTFTIEVTNQGTLDANNFAVTDYLPAGFALNDANWTDNGNGTATFTNTGTLTPGNSVQIPITLRANTAANGDLTQPS